MRFCRILEYYCITIHNCTLSTQITKGRTEIVIDIKLSSHTDKEIQKGNKCFLILLKDIAAGNLNLEYKANFTTAVSEFRFKARIAFQNTSLVFALYGSLGFLRQCPNHLLLENGHSAIINKYCMYEIHNCCPQSHILLDTHFCNDQSTYSNFCTLNV